MQKYHDGKNFSTSFFKNAYKTISLVVLSFIKFQISNKHENVKFCDQTNWIRMFHRVGTTVDLLL